MSWLLTIHMVGWVCMSALMYWRVRKTEAPAPNSLTEFRRYMAFWGIAAVWELWLVEDLLKSRQNAADDPDSDGW